MNAIWNDIRFAIRTLRKSPVFTIVAVLSLALGIGANTAIFTLLDQVLLRLLPVKSPRELVMLGGNGPTHGSNWGRNSFSHPMYLDLAANNQVFSGLMCRFPTSLSLSFGGQTERVRAELVSGTYFQVLGVQAAVGRLLTPNDDRIPNGHPVAVLSHSYWKSRFGGDPDIAGKEVTINGHNMTVIGVAQRGFDGVELEHQSQVFVPMMMKAEMTPGWDDMKNRRAHWVNIFGRLKPGVSEAQAQASLQPFFRSVLEMEVKEAAFNDASEATRQKFLSSVLLVLPGGQGRSSARQALSSPLWVLMAITAGVLLIACANVANLLIARAGARQKEMAVRLSLGATRARIINAAADRKPAAGGARRTGGNAAGRVDRRYADAVDAAGYAVVKAIDYPGPAHPAVYRGRLFGNRHSLRIASRAAGVAVGCRAHLEGSSRSRSGGRISSRYPQRTGGGAGDFVFAAVELLGGATMVDSGHAEMSGNDTAGEGRSRHLVEAMATRSLFPNSVSSYCKGRSAAG